MRDKNDPIRPQRCQCGDKVIRDGQVCIKCGKWVKS